MKKFAWFFVALVALTMFSCHKPEGDVPGVYPDGKDKVKVEIKENTLLTIRFDSTLLAEDWVRLEKMTLRCIEPGIDTIYQKIIQKDTILNVKTWCYQDTLWGVKPFTSYVYDVITKDLFSQDTTSLKEVKTMNAGYPKVYADSAKKIENTLYFYGTVTNHWRMLKDGSGTYRGGRFLWGPSQEEINQEIGNVSVVSTSLVGDSLTLVVTGQLNSSEYSSAVWYRTVAKNAWGTLENRSVENCYTGMHEALTFPVINGYYGEDWAILRGNSVKGEAEDVLYEHGFYFSENQEDISGSQPASHCKIPATDNLDWGYRYQLDMRPLEPNTKYYFRAYLQINNSFGAMSLGEVMCFTTLGNVDVTIDDPLDYAITANSIGISGWVNGVDMSSVEEKGFLWKTREGDETVVDFDNKEGMVEGSSMFGMPDNQFGGLIERLESQTEYLICAYVRLDDGRAILSETKTIKTL